MFRTLLSYIIPEKLESRAGNDGVTLNVYLDKGKIKIYTENTNYSGGKLKDVFKRALKGFDFSDSDEILILGFGLGSIWEIIRENKSSNAIITGVEYDKAMLDILQTYKPNICADINTTLHAVDCQSFMQTNKNLFNYIFIDLFIDREVAPIVLNQEFWKTIKLLSDKETIVVFNSMGLTKLELRSWAINFDIYKEMNIFKTNSIFFLKAIK